jgi:mRNA-degrading endonuclease YafQ of YafQ-DinJ toxin-antitoxin module
MGNEKKYQPVFLKGFIDEFEGLSDIHKELVTNKVALIMDNPFYPSLWTHKMRGKKRYFESYANRDIRIIWQFGDNNTILLTDVGHHDVLKKY